MSTFDEVEFRKAQEGMARVVKAGGLNAIAKANWDLFVSFRKVGFLRKEAFELLKIMIGKTNLSSF